ncbi:glucosamine inositolphosphorylceramide transferase family protein [Longibaculum muris]|uniref:glucosamine inositolphosphorylceramide transferase family protein n=1 Tax=Longibaculum muris TaxID=1796628 RepID=UPI0022E5BD94|nr:hypothetical protein [Longibaculum muris]
MIRKKFSVIDWNIGFISTSFSELLQGKEYTIEWMKHEYKDRFFADPFVYNESDTCFEILAEEYLFVEMIGRIVKLTVNKKDKQLLDRKLLLKTKYHLSYPFISGNIFIPEQSKSGKLIAYDFDSKKERVLANIGLVDATILERNGQKWIFATLLDGTPDAARKNLSRFKIDDNGNIDIDSKLLIKNDLYNSRPGGAFFESEGILYRPAQNSTNAVYGESISINKVLENSEKKYLEECVLTIDSHQSNKYTDGLHTFNITCEGAVVDGFQLSFRPLQKILSKLVHMGGRSHVK